MGIFGMFKGKTKDAVNQFSGNKDFLEGLLAGCALVAAAPDSVGGKGEISDDEYDAALGVIRSNSTVSAAFNSGEIESVFGKMAPKTKTRSGKAELENEIREVVARDKTGAMGQAIVLAMLDVADADGSLSDGEVAVMKKVAGICNVNYDKLAA